MPLQQKNDIMMKGLHDFRVALMLLTRLPLRPPDLSDDAPPAQASWSYPLVGLVLAILAGVVAHLAMALGLSTQLAAGLALICLIGTTGAMHEDGLADCADGFWGGWDRERRLEIMRDSRIGAYGVIALILCIGLRWLALAQIFANGFVLPALILAAMSSRAFMVLVMEALPNAREDGLSKSTGRPDPAHVRIAVGLAIAAGFLAPGFAGFLAMGIGYLAAKGLAQIARTKIGGQTGDVLGATQQVVEITVLLSLVALL